MGIFGKKKEKTVDLTERYRKQQERMSNLRENMRSSGSSANSGSFNSQGSAETGIGSGFGFLDNASSYSSGNTAHGYGSSQSDFEGSDDSEKRRKLAKRLMDLTDKIEEVSNQIYHLQQRVEVLEKKFNPQGLGF